LSDDADAAWADGEHELGDVPPELPDDEPPD
jgi:hypothetical protein